MSQPNLALSIARYRHHASGYDATTHRMEPVRVRAVRHLALRPGDTVLDVACGTGKSFALLQERIGRTGRIVGVDSSPEMLDIAGDRVRAAGWTNVTLVRSSMEAAALPCPFDSVLFNYTHDVLQSPAALARIFAYARPGARVVSAGMKLFPWWLAPLNIVALAKAYPYTTTLNGLARPWRGLAGWLDDFDVESMYGGIAYVARGRFVPRSQAG
jgi:ubiquinone/menaquinone biosynthesis C-methylase UbiE